MSGGGFRATLFHLGVVRRLNELGVLRRLAAITSVSGGSILNGVLATRWSSLECGADGMYSGFDEHVAQPVRDFCSQDLRTRLLLGTRLDWANWPRLFRDFFAVPADFLAKAYMPLFCNQSLVDVPAPALHVPRFVFCATNTRTGACWHFHAGPAGRMGDFYTGYSSTEPITVAKAVAASSAFPPGFAALQLLCETDREWSRLDPWGEIRPESTKRPPPTASERRHIVLTDGGVYDNLGVEPVWNRFTSLLVSDAGMPFDPKGTCYQYLIARLSRAFDISANQVGAVRKRWLVERLGHDHRGAMWAIDTLVEEFPGGGHQCYSPRVRHFFPRIRTDLNSFTIGEMACLENHGYAMADAAIRSRAPWASTGDCPFQWPNPEWAGDAAAECALKDSSSRRLLYDTWRYCAHR
jgi:NTE family protein